MEAWGQGGGGFILHYTFFDFRFSFQIIILVKNLSEVMIYKEIGDQ